jgi:hypothetical protein
MAAKIGSCNFSKVVEKTWKIVAPGSVSCQNPQQRVALRFTRPFVNHDCSFPFAFVDRSRPAKDPDKPQAVEAGVAVNSFVDLHRSDRSAIAIAWPPIELARTTVRTIAVNELPRFDAPFHVGH